VFDFRAFSLKNVAIGKFAIPEPSKNEEEI